MTVNELYKWISDPSALTKSSLPELKQLLEEYPYFQAGRMLYLKNLSVVEDIRFQKELKRMSVYIPDRKSLYLLIENKPAESQGELNGKTEERENEGTGEKTKNQYIAIAPTDYISWLENNAEDIVPPESEDNRLKHQDLIDSFIESDGKLQLDRQGNEEKKPENDEENEIISSNASFDKNSLDDSYFTETLARVYFGQRRYDKALEIFRALNLKYPEKNVYFADQIRYLEKIINIKK
jgi:hypothetical protein